MIKGIQQVAEYNSSATRLFYTVTDNTGVQHAPDAAPQITIYSPGGAERVAATNTTVVTATTEGWLLYDAQTAEFAIGELLTGGTSGATGLIQGQRKSGTTGRLYLVDVDGTFENNETITDSGSGSATEDATLFSCEYYYDLDTSGTSSYPVGQNYAAKITYDISSVSFVRWLYFDVAFFPATGPWVTSIDVDRRFPVLVGARPEEWTDWSPAIQAAHSDLIRKLHALGEQAAFFVKRDQEMWGIEIALVRAEIARALGESPDTIDRWESRATEAWASRGEFTFDTDDDQEIDSDVKVVSSGFSR